MEAAPTPNPGWYRDPTTPSNMRWWDGENWTEHVSVSGDAAEPAGFRAEGREAADPRAVEMFLVIGGYVGSVAVPFAGLGLGVLIYLFGRQREHAVWIIGLSLLFLALHYALDLPFVFGA